MRWRCSPHLLLKHIFQPTSRKWLIVLGLPNEHWMLSRVAQDRLLGSGTPVSPGVGRVTWTGEAARVWDGRESWACAQCTPSGPEQSIDAFRGFSPLLPGPTLCVCVSSQSQKSNYLIVCVISWVLNSLRHKLNICRAKMGPHWQSETPGTCTKSREARRSGRATFLFFAFLIYNELIMGSAMWWGS